MYTHTCFGCLICSAAPQATPPGYSHSNSTQLGATHYGCCRANRAPRCREERGRGLEEERSRASCGVQASPEHRLLRKRSPLQLPEPPPLVCSRWPGAMWAPTPQQGHRPQDLLGCGCGGWGGVSWAPLYVEGWGIGMGPPVCWRGGGDAWSLRWGGAVLQGLVPQISRGVWEVAYAVPGAAAAVQRPAEDDHAAPRAGPRDARLSGAAEPEQLVHHRAGAGHGPRREKAPVHVRSDQVWSVTWGAWGVGVGGAPGPHRNTARQAMDGLWTEVWGQQKQSNNPGNNQHILNTPIIGRR